MTYYHWLGADAEPDNHIRFVRNGKVVRVVIIGSDPNPDTSPIFDVE